RDCGSGELGDGLGLQVLLAEVSGGAEPAEDDGQDEEPFQEAAHERASGGGGAFQVIGSRCGPQARRGLVASPISSADPTLPAALLGPSPAPPRTWALVARPRPWARSNPSAGPPAASGRTGPRPAGRCLGTGSAPRTASGPAGSRAFGPCGTAGRR